ncbi:MAG TPA: polysaccharide deacetylase family protein, partial [Candidatus Goldiibacteriota bacterium]|nr:polysaccharide deacetylase family protein [Candidatus Goldiibacteriota bacterium]
MKIAYFGVLLLCCVMALASFVRATETAYKVLPWNGCKAAISLTYDDGDPIHLDLVIPEMKRRGIRGTFFLIADKIQRIDEWKKAAKSGMEIGNHSSGHRRASELTPEDEIFEVDHAADFLREQFKQQVQVFAYPFSEISDGLRARVENNSIAARGGGWGDRLYIPEYEPDWHDIRCVATMTDLKFEDYKGWIDQAMAAGAWTVFMIHAIEGSDWWQPVPKKTYIKTLDYLAKNKGTLWVAPMGEVAAYWKAQKIVENADIKFQNDAVEVSWNKPAPFPAGITLKIAVDT